MTHMCKVAFRLGVYNEQPAFQIGCTGNIFTFKEGKWSYIEEAAKDSIKSDLSFKRAKIENGEFMEVDEIE